MTSSITSNAQSFGIGGRVFAVGFIGVIGMVLIGATLFWSIGRLEGTATSIDRAHRVGSLLAKFDHELSQSRLQFDAFKDTRKKAALEQSETLIEQAKASIAQVETEAGSIELSAELPKAKQLVEAIRDAVGRVIPHAKRTGTESLQGQELALRGALDILLDKRRELTLAFDKPNALPGMLLAVKITDLAAIVAEASALPDRLLQLKFAGELSEAEAAIDALKVDQATTTELKGRLQQLETMFVTWLDASSAVQNDTAITGQVFDMVTPVVARIIDQNAKMANVAKEEAQAVKQRTMMVAAATLLFCLLLAALAAWLIGRSITRPIAGIRNAMQRLAEGATDQTIPHTSARNEIGSMARSVQVFQNAMQERERLTGVQLRAATDQAGRSQNMAAAAQSFDSALNETQTALATSSGQLESFAESLSRMSGALDRHARESLDASTGTAERSASVATAAEQLTQSIAEIAAQTDRANAAVQQAVESSNASQAQMLQLKESAAGISSIVEIINTVAAQTNLLALNATIEAARAGHAGRGFAVVAQEIKALAEQTASATARISKQIHGMQHAASEGAEAVGALAETLSQVEESSVTVSAAVRQQDQSVAEIARIMAGLSNDADAARDAANRTFAETEEAKSMADAMLKVSSSVSDISTRLQNDAKHFMKVVNAA